MKAMVLGEFPQEEVLYEAARALRARGGAVLDIHSPYPLHGADDALGLRRSTVPMVALAFGLIGAFTGYFIQWYMSAWDWPLNVGNRPPHSAPAFIPVTFELGILFSSLSIFIGLLAWYFGFPRVHHPVFEVEAFRSASIDGLWLSAEVDGLDAEPIAAELRRFGARNVAIVPEATR